MLPLQLCTARDRPLAVLALGAHPDDIEIGAGGLLLSLVDARCLGSVQYVVLTGTPLRHAEARAASGEFLPGIGVTLDLHDLPEGRGPAWWDTAKDLIEAVARSFTPDLVLAPSRDDAHQDHRVLAEIVPTVFRDALCLSYEIPKWDGDLGRPSVYLPLSEALLHRKVELLHKCFPSQRSRHWWDDAVFVGLARLRGMECQATFAEAYHCTKSVLSLTSRSSHV